MLFLLIARNRPGPEAVATRDRLRPRQFETVRAMAASGAMRIGGALLDESGAPLGSMAVLDFPGRAELDSWLADHPYRRNGVWDSVEICILQPAPVFAGSRHQTTAPAA